MSIAQRQAPVAVADDVASPVARLSSPGVDDQDGGSRSALPSSPSLCAFLGVFVLDRLGETPAGCVSRCSAAAVAACSSSRCSSIAGSGAAAVGATGSAAQPQASAPRRPIAGHHGTGRSEAEQARSRALCEAAIRQVAHEAQQQICGRRRRSRGMAAVELARRGGDCGGGRPGGVFSLGRRQRLGPVSRALESHAAVHVRPARCRCRNKSWFLTASRSGSRLVWLRTRVGTRRRGRPNGTTSGRFSRAAARRPIRV